MTAPRLICAAIMAALFAAGAGAATDPAQWNLDRLMATLAQNKSGRARFVETQYLKIAAKPLESSGELIFAAPDHLEKHTVSPKPENLVIDGDMLTIDRNNHKLTIPLRNYPELAAFIESIRATLAGNRYALEEAYKVTVAGHGDDWTLTLVPIDTRMLKAVSTITLAGTRDTLGSVTIQQADGDHSVMRLQKGSAN